MNHSKAGISLYSSACSQMLADILSDTRVQDDTKVSKMLILNKLVNEFIE